MTSGKGVRSVCLVFATVLASTVWGCSHPYARRENAHSLSQIEWTWSAFEARETRGSQNLDRTLAMIEESRAHHQAKFREDLEAARAWAAEDVAQWEAQRGPIAAEVAHVFAGNPDHAAWTAVWMLH